MLPEIESDSESHGEGWIAHFSCKEEVCPEDCQVGKWKFRAGYRKEDPWVQYEDITVQCGK